MFGLEEESHWDPFKRPGVDAFLEHLAQLYEILVYADEQSLHVDAVIDKLDVNHCIAHRLSRSATRYQNGKRFKDLSKLNRDQARVIYLSAYALENCLQHENCVQIKPCKKQKHDIDDTTLLDFIPFLESVALSSPADVRPVLQSYEGLNIPTEFIRRFKEQQQR
ncbi:hypothetical protein PIB30_065873 [Stylosanthes scabra]|uniref:Mitochondrial import inner membrane translocase subunit TIM50 n=1 Tax=Stylosanthes scabra TaxID=79078 RepID=A0ABU6SM55_9FABA|nr:hypothetical protein [Stylosanthes scabra]